MNNHNELNSREFLFSQIAAKLHVIGKEIEFFWNRRQPNELQVILQPLFCEYTEVYQELRYLDVDAVQELPDIDDLLINLGIPSPFPLTSERYLELRSKIDYDKPIGSDQVSRQQHTPHHGFHDPHDQNDEEDTPKEA